MIWLAGASSVACDHDCAGHLPWWGWAIFGIMVFLAFVGLIVLNCWIWFGDPRQK